MSSDADPPAPALPDPAAYGARLDLAGQMSYGDYLHLDDVLGAQHPRSRQHDEWLFIIQHQTSELWMKLALIELRAACDAIGAEQLQPAFKMMARVARIVEQLVGAWTVLGTLTPSEYGRLRPYLGSSSGFQSWQYREIEFLLGNRNPAMLKPHAHRADIHDRLQAALRAPSLYDQAIRLLARRGFAIAPALLARDVTTAHAFDDTLARAWLQVYGAPEAHWDLYELAEELVDLEEAFRLWRYRHLSTVERIIGAKPGTGGSTGTGYLRRMLDVTLFPELWQVRTDL